MGINIRMSYHPQVRFATNEMFIFFFNTNCELIGHNKLFLRAQRKQERNLRWTTFRMRNCEVLCEQPSERLGKMLKYLANLGKSVHFGKDLLIRWISFSSTFLGNGPCNYWLNYKVILRILSSGEQSSSMSNLFTVFVSSLNAFIFTWISLA